MDQAEVYRDRQGEFRYRIRAGNYEVIAEGEGYLRKQDVIDVLEQHFPGVAIVDLSDEAT